MKSQTVLGALLSLALLTGCGSLIPKNVEFFQRKVKPFPEKTAKQDETQRQAAAYLSDKTEEIKLAAIAAGQTNLTATATEANVVADALTEVMGPPDDPWRKEAVRLAALLKEEQAKHNADVAKFAKTVDKDAGKKIEGTGFIRINYFLYIGILAGIVFIVWTALKWYGSVNPIVGAGTNVVGRVGVDVLKRGYTEIIQGGEAFKAAVQNSELAADVKAKVMGWFQTSHRMEQSSDTQNIVATLTK